MQAFKVILIPLAFKLEQLRELLLRLVFGG